MPNKYIDLVRGTGASSSPASVNPTGDYFNTPVATPKKTNPILQLLRIVSSTKQSPISATEEARRAYSPSVDEVIAEANVDYQQRVRDGKYGLPGMDFLYGGVGSFLQSAAKLVPTTVKAASENFVSTIEKVPALKYLRDLGGDVEDLATGTTGSKDMLTTISDSALEYLDAAQQDNAKRTNNKWIALAGASTGTILSGIGIGMITKSPGLTAAVLAGIDSQDFYTDARKLGKSPQEALLLSAAYGIPSAALEKIGLNSILKSEKVIASVGKEVSTELLQQGHENVLRQYALGKDVHLYDNMIEATLGAIVGVGVGKLAVSTLAKLPEVRAAITGGTSKERTDFVRDLLKTATGIAQKIQTTLSTPVEGGGIPNQYAGDVADVLAFRASQNKSTPEEQKKIPELRNKNAEYVAKIQEEVQALRESTREEVVNTPAIQISTTQNSDNTYAVDVVVDAGGKSFSIQNHGAFPTQQEAVIYAQQKIYDTAQTNDEVLNAAKTSDELVNQWSNKKSAKPISLFEDIQDSPEFSDILPEQGYTLQKALVAIARKMEVRVGERYSPRGTLGSFFTKTENIRLKGITDISVFAHELFHYVDKKANIAERIATGSDVESELLQVYKKNYPGSGGDRTLKLKEGIATAFQKYIESPTSFSESYPEITKQLFSKDGELSSGLIQDALTETRKAVATFQKLSDLQKGAAFLGEEQTYNKKYFSVLENIRSWWADDKYKLEVISNKLGTEFTAEDSSIDYRMLDNIGTIVENNVQHPGSYMRYKDGNWETTLPYNIGTLKASIETMGKAFYGKNGDVQMRQQFDGWLVARRLHEQYQELGRLKEQDSLFIDMEEEPSPEQEQLQKSIKDLETILTNSKRTKEEVQKTYESGKEIFEKKQKGDPVSVATMFDNLNKEDLEFLHDKEVQLIDDETYAALSGKKGYASAKRVVVDDFLQEGSQQGGMKGTSVSSLKKQKGSSMAVNSPLHSLMMNHFETVRKGYLAIADNKLGEALTNIPELFQPLPYDAAKERDPNVFIYRKGYKKQMALMHPEVKAVLDNIKTPQIADAGYAISKAISRMTVVGITGMYPWFSLSNMTMDALSAFAQTKTQLNPINSSAKLVLSALKGALDSNMNTETLSVSEKQMLDNFKKFFILGGHRQTFVGAFDGSTTEVMQNIDAESKSLKEIAGKIKDGDLSYFSTLLKRSASGALEVVTLPSKYSDILPRSLEFHAAKMNGDTDAVAMEKAARVTTAFSHKGELKQSFFGKLFTLVPFANAGIQVTDNSIRALSTAEGRRRAGQLMFAIAAFLFAGQMSTWALGTDKQKDQYKEQNPDERGKYVQFPNPSGEGLISIRIPDQYALPGTLLNMATEEFLGRNTWKLSDYGVVAGNSWIPKQLQIYDPIGAGTSWAPPIAKQAIEMWANMKMYPQGVPIETADMVKNSTQNRYNAKTTQVAKTLAGLTKGLPLEISPQKMDHLLEGVFGRSIKFVTGKESLLDISKAYVKKDYPYSGKRMKQFIDLMGKNKQELEDIKDKKMQDPAEAARIMKDKEKIGSIDGIYSLWQDAYKADPESEATVQLRTQLLKQIDTVLN